LQNTIPRLFIKPEAKRLENFDIVWNAGFVHYNAKQHHALHVCNALSFRTATVLSQIVRAI